MKYPVILSAALLAVMATSACTQSPPGQDPASAFTITEHGTFDAPWAMTFLADGRLLVTEKAGNLLLVNLDDGSRSAIGGVPDVVNSGQGGLGDVLLHPAFPDNGWVYISYAEAGDDGTSGAAVARARLDLDGAQLRDLSVIWQQYPKVKGNGHFAYRLAFDGSGHLWITSGERQTFDYAQDMKSNLGKIIRLNDDGSVPADNPFVDQGGVAAQVWSLGHRNPLGIAFDSKGQPWNHEMGPKGGDELNRVERGANYGYPIVSNGNHYDGRSIPDHDTRPEFMAPQITWTPVISPAGFVIYSGDEFPEWRGNGLIGGLSSQSLVRVRLDAEPAEVQRFGMRQRIREVEQGPDGAIWLLEDGSGGRLLKLTRPRS